MSSSLASLAFGHSVILLSPNLHVTTSSLHEELSLSMWTYFVYRWASEICNESNCPASFFSYKKSTNRSSCSLSHSLSLFIHFAGQPAGERIAAWTRKSNNTICEYHLSEKNYGFSENLPRSQALPADQLSHIIWHSSISHSFTALHFSPSWDPVTSLPQYLRNAPTNG